MLIISQLIRNLIVSPPRPCNMYYNNQSYTAIVILNPPDGVYLTNNIIIKIRHGGTRRTFRRDHNNLIYRP